ncbi:hypothetical protein ColTof4_14001 [Colletotrichum tofieldiae]|nr:hypothetical protein ColTof3_14634 [Colletotrichum tofieldiae]GKT81578.1 hypothetical protein ColTof4_14001 [Colletotrichum tofieldiae]
MTPTSFRSIELINQISCHRPRIPGTPADIIAQDAHLARYSLDLGTYDILCFSEILDPLLTTDGLTSLENPEAANLVRDKVKSALQCRLKKLDADSRAYGQVGAMHLELGQARLARPEANACRSFLLPPSMRTMTHAVLVWEVTTGNEQPADGNGHGPGSCG